MPKGMILLSVILPTYNRGHCVWRMIDSILEQDFKNYELIIIDDGSTDGTMEMLKKRYGNTDIRIIYKENGGVSSARNLGISLARGEYITFVDSDDYLLDGFFRDIYENILKHKADVYVYAGFSKRRGRLSKVPLFWGDWEYGNGQKVHKHGREFAKDFCLFGGNSWACAKAFRAPLIRENNLLFEEHISYGEDMLFNLQAYLSSSSVVAIPQEYYVCQILDDGLSRGCLSSKKKVLDLLEAYGIILEKCLDYGAYFSLNYLRHMRRWFLISFFAHNTKVKVRIKELYSKIVDIPYCRIEALEIVVAKKSLLCALFVYRILYVFSEIRSKIYFFGFFVKFPFRVLRKMIKNWNM